MCIRNGYLYWSKMEGGFFVVEISDNTKTRIIKNIDIEGHSGFMVSLNNYLAVGTTGGIHFYDTSNPRLPVLNKVISEYPGDVHGRDNYIFITNSRKGSLLLDISDLENPQKVAKINEYFHDLDIYGNYIISGFNNMKVYKIED